MRALLWSKLTAASALLPALLAGAGDLGGRKPQDERPPEAPRVFRRGPVPGGAILSYTAILLRPAFSPDGLTLAAGSVNGAVLLWDARKYTLRKILSGYQVPVRAVAFSPDGKLLASGSSRFVAPGAPPAPAEIRIWDLRTGKVRRTMKGPAADINTLAFSPDGKRLGAGYAFFGRWPAVPEAEVRNVLQLWEVESGRLLRGFWDRSLPELKRDLEPKVFTLGFLPGGRSLVSGGTDDMRALVWEPDTGKLQRAFGVPDPFNPGAPGIGSIQYVGAANAQHLWLGGLGGSVTRWDLKTGRLERSIPPGVWEVPGALFDFMDMKRTRAAAVRGLSSDGRFAAGWVHETDWTAVWDLETQKLRYDLTRQHDLAAEVVTLFNGERMVAGPGEFVFSPDGKRLASFNGSEAIRLWTCGKDLLAAP
jgi:WD40 repeat protein